MATRCSPSTMDHYSCILALSNFITALVSFIASGVDVQSDSQTLDLVFSSHYDTIFNAVYQLIISRRQTPFALFHIIVFLDRFFSHVQFIDLTNEDPQGAEELILLLRVLFVVALETTGGSDDEPVQDRMTLTEKMGLVGFKKFAEYSQVKQNIENRVLSPYTGTTRLSQEEWAEFHTDLLHLDLPIPQSNCDDQDMAAIIGTFLHHARYTSADGDVPLCQLSLLPIPRCDSPPSPLRYEFSLSTPASFPPSYPSFQNDFKHAESNWDRPQVKRAPASSDSMCSLSEPVLHLFQPQPRREIEIDLLELEAMAEEGDIEFVQVDCFEVKARDEGFWRCWLDRCLDNVDKLVSE